MNNLTKREIEDFVKSVRKLQENIRYLEEAHNTHIRSIMERVYLKYDIEPNVDLYSLKDELLKRLPKAN